MNQRERQQTAKRQIAGLAAYFELGPVAIREDVWTDDGCLVMEFGAGLLYDVFWDADGSKDDYYQSFQRLLRKHGYDWQPLNERMLHIHPVGSFDEQMAEKAAWNLLYATKGELAF